MEDFDWSQCPLVEVDPEIQSGAPVLRGTRLPVSAIIGNFEYGATVPEISQWFDVPQEQVQAMLTSRVIKFSFALCPK
ncbi:MAG: DUF433 domain-containing protein [Acidobacteriaceae bacterium]|nr:DUF433 domain-containing protein [Acidobacteriaceae bacterium]